MFEGHHFDSASLSNMLQLPFYRIRLILLVWNGFPTEGKGLFPAFSTMRDTYC